MHCYRVITGGHHWHWHRQPAIDEAGGVQGRRLPRTVSVSGTRSEPGPRRSQLEVLPITISILVLGTQKRRPTPPVLASLK
jgi:hypothetical protein